MRIAEEDLKTAKILVSNPGGRKENTLFIIQQALEKTVKGVLCKLGANIPLTHDLGALFSVLPTSLPRPPGEIELLGLSEYASIRRYEEGHYNPTQEEIQKAYDLSIQVLSWGKGIVASPP